MEAKQLRHPDETQSRVNWLMEAGQLPHEAQT